MKRFWQIIYSFLRFIITSDLSIEDFLFLISKNGCQKISVEIRAYQKFFFVNFRAHHCRNGKVYMWSKTKEFISYSECFEWIISNIRIAKKNNPEMDVSIFTAGRGTYDNQAIEKFLQLSKEKSDSYRSTFIAEKIY